MSRNPSSFTAIRQYTSPTPILNRDYFGASQMTAAILAVLKSSMPLYSSRIADLLCSELIIFLMTDLRPFLGPL